MANIIGGSVVWNLDVDNSKFNKGLSQARGAVDDFEGSLKSAEQGSKLFLGGVVAIGAAAGSIVAFGLKTAASLESARQGFVALLGSAKEADDTMARIKMEAASTPFELTGLVAGTQALTAITKDGNKAIDILLDVGKAIATSGKGQAELDRVVLNLQQISSTGKVTAMDIRQFQSAIPMFNDIITAAGLTIAELQDAENAAELLFGAFKTAGAEGGLTAQGFTAQAGTLNQLWSNLVDTITIGSAQFVELSGIVDVAKNAMAGLIDTINKFTTPEAIKGFISFMVEWGPVLAGAIIGALVPAVYALAVSFWAMMVPLIPFILIGAAIGLVIMGLIKIFQNWGTIVETVKVIFSIFSQSVTLIFNAIKDFFIGIWGSITNTFNTFVDTLKNIGTQIANTVKAIASPFVWLYTNIIEPITMLINAIIQRVFYEIFIFLKDKIFIPITTFISETMEKIRNIISSILNYINNNIIQPVTTAIKNVFISVWNAISGFTSSVWNKIRDSMTGPVNSAKGSITSTLDSLKNFISNVWNGILSFFSSMGGKIVDAIMKPFYDVKNKIEKVANDIRNLADKISPFHRESPSLVDNVIKGLGIIRGEFESLNSLSLQPAFIQPSGLGRITPGFENDFNFGGGTGGNKEVIVNIDTVNNSADIEAIGREVAFKASIL